MYPFKRILVPTDFSLCAEAAFSHALYLGQRYKAEVHLLHVAPPSARESRDGEIEWPDKITDPRPGMPAYTEHWQDLPLRRAIVHHADPVAAILTYAREQAIDFIVMGAHGDRGTGFFLNLGVESSFLGHTAEQVVRHAGCPVLRVVMPNGRSPERIRRLLVPVDGSSLSLLALAYAKDMAALYDARLTLLHVLPPRSSSAAKKEEEASEEQARQELLDLFNKTKGPDVSAGFHIARGRPDRMIRTFVETHKVDLVVMGAHSDLGQDVLGIVTERVVRKAPCPVLTVRRGKPDLKASARSQRISPIPIVFL